MPGVMPPKSLRPGDPGYKGKPQNHSAPRPSGGVPKAFRVPGITNTPAAHGVNVRGLQMFLRHKGFDVTVDGHLGPETKSALRDAIDKGIMKNPTLAETHLIQGLHGQVLGPKAFDTMIHNAGRPPFLQHPIDSKGNTAGNAMGGLNAGAAGLGSSSSGFVNDKGTTKALKAATGKAIPSADANFGQMFDVNKMADAMANEQFQPQINDAQLTVNRDPAQAAQNEKDVQDWYNQVLAAQGNAANADTAATNAGVGSINDATKALVASLGGSANQGAGEAAAAGQNGASTLQAIGNSQSGLDQELAPILAAQAAQQKTNQANIDQTKQANDQQMLSDLQGQRGNAETTAQMQLMSANNSLDQARNAALMNILQYNNSLGQQKFQNELGLTDAQIAAAMNGVSMGEKQAQAAYYARRAAGLGSGSSRSASQLDGISNHLLAELANKGLITGGSGTPYKMAPGVKPAQVLHAAQNFAAGYGSLPNGFLGGTVLGGIQGY